MTERNDAYKKSIKNYGHEYNFFVSHNFIIFRNKYVFQLYFSNSKKKY